MVTTFAEATASGPRRRSRWIACCALLLLLPVVFAVTAHRDIVDWVHSHDLIGQDVPPGGSATYLGSLWTLDTFRVITGGDPRLAMPDDRAIVVVRIAVDLRADVDAAWQVCTPALDDESGRRWLPLTVMLSGGLERLVAPGGKAAQSCGSAVLAKPKAGSRIAFDAMYLVPRDAIPTLRPVVSTFGGRPYYLRFMAPPTG